MEKQDPVDGVEERFEDCIQRGGSLRDAAEIWASVMTLPGPDFLRMNRAVESRWPRSLGKLKEMAWRINQTGSPHKKK